MTRVIEPNQRPRSFSEEELRAIIREEVANVSNATSRDDIEEGHVKLGAFKGPWWMLWTFGWAIFGASWCIFWWWTNQ